MTRRAGAFRAGPELEGEQGMINFDEEIRNFRSSMDIASVEDEIVKSDLTDLKDVLMEILKGELRESDS